MQLLATIRPQSLDPYTVNTLKYNQLKWVYKYNTSTTTIVILYIYFILKILWEKCHMGSLVPHYDLILFEATWFARWLPHGPTCLYIYIYIFFFRSFFSYAVMHHIYWLYCICMPRPNATWIDMTTCVLENLEFQPTDHVKCSFFT